MSLRDLPDRWVGALVLLVSFLGRTYPDIRYGGMWIQGDANIFVVNLRLLATYHSVTAANSVFYTNGFAWQIMAYEFASITGLPYLFAVYSLGAAVGSLMVLCIYVLYRKAGGGKGSAACLSLIAGFSPNILLETTRGSDSVIVFTFFAFMLVLFFRELDGNSSRSLQGVMILFIIGIASANVGYGLVFGAAFLFCSIILSIFGKRIASWYVIAISVIYPLIQVIWIYPVSSNLIRLGALIIRSLAEPAIFQPSTYIGGYYPSILDYVFLHVSTFVVLPLASVWCAIQITKLRKRLSRDRFFFVCFYSAGFGLTVLGFVTSGTGLVSGNLFLRFIPLVEILAPFMIYFGFRDIRRLRRFGVIARHGRIQTLAIIIVGFLAIPSILVVSQEPNLTNYTPYYSSKEGAGTSWSVHFAAPNVIQQTDERLWLVRMLFVDNYASAVWALNLTSVKGYGSTSGYVVLSETMQTRYAYVFVGPSLIATQLNLTAYLSQDSVTYSNGAVFEAVRN